MRPIFLTIASGLLFFGCFAEEPAPTPAPPPPAPAVTPPAPPPQPPVGVVQPPANPQQANRPGANRQFGNGQGGQGMRRFQNGQNGNDPNNNGGNRMNRLFGNNADPRAALLGEGLGALLRGNPVEAASRALGIDLEELRDKHAGVESLPLGAARREVLNVPVGGVDLPGGTGNGWKMEQVFKLTDEQQKSLSALRDEYAAEQNKLEAEIAAQEKALAEKAATLRYQYEEKANALLAGADKDAKVKMDVIGKDSHTATEKARRDAIALYDPADAQQGLALLRMIREKSLEIARDAENKLLPLLPAESKDRIEEAIRNNAEARDQINRMLNINPEGNGGKRNKAERKAMKEKGEAKTEPEKEAPANF